MKTEIEELLRKKEIKITANRILILELLLNTPHSLSIATIEKALPWADRATIFRTLKTFEKKALLHAVKDDDKPIKYAICSDACEVNYHKIHPHFHCDTCGNTFCLYDYDFRLPKLPDNYTADKYSLVINGICSNCQKHNT